jgi:hypothetical protein
MEYKKLERLATGVLISATLVLIGFGFYKMVKESLREKEIARKKGMTAEMANVNRDSLQELVIKYDGVKKADTLYQADNGKYYTRESMIKYAVEKAAEEVENKYGGK